jgi:D-tyrosyl-tRNA(Tyr) deacylase
MRALVQRVREGHVSIGGIVNARIGKGYVILLGVRHGDSMDDAKFLADRCAHLRVMEDPGGKMNLSLRDVGGDALVVPQFTLYADAQTGNRPGFTDAARPEEAMPLYDAFVARLRAFLGDGRVATGTFGAMMEVHIANDGPVTILIESPQTNTTVRNA